MKHVEIKVHIYMPGQLKWVRCSYVLGYVTLTMKRDPVNFRIQIVWTEPI